MIDERGGIQGRQAVKALILAIRADIAPLVGIVAKEKIESLLESIDYLKISVGEMMTETELYELQKLQAHADHLLEQLTIAKREKMWTEEANVQLRAKCDKLESERKKLVDAELYNNALRYAQWCYSQGNFHCIPLLTFGQWLESDWSKPQKPNGQVSSEESI